jgi:hypothetical protein
MSRRRGKLTAHFPGGEKKAEIEVNVHPTDSLLTCDDCGATCAGDATAMAAFVIEHTDRHCSS